VTAAGSALFPEGSNGTLVEAGWLREHLEEVVLLDASISRSVGPDGRGSYGDGRIDFTTAHLPGARFADLIAAFSDPDAAVAFTRPSAAQFAAAATALGIGDDTPVVVYDRLGGAWAARLWWVFRSFGFEAIRVLDGGAAAWTGAGGALESGPSPDRSRPVTDLSVRELDGWFTDLVDVQALGAQPDPHRPVVCALRGGDFAAGHLAGSVSLPYPQLLSADGTIDRQAAAAAVADLGTTEPVLYCGGGINAAGLGLALRAAGLAGARIYDGSLNEWRVRGLPLVAGENP